MTITTTGPFIPGWSSQPFPNFSLSASGLVVLADLSTIARRTALRGGSSWLDSLLLAPGLHYQQAADDLFRGGTAQILTAVERDRDGNPITHQMVNQAVVSYVLRVAKEGRTVVLDVGEVPLKKQSWPTRRRENVRRGQRAMVYGGSAQVEESLSWVAQLLYVASPILTCVAIVLLVLFKDCECFCPSTVLMSWRSTQSRLTTFTGWALVIIGLLMASRILNILVIKSRSKPRPSHLPAPFALPASLPAPPRITQYTVTLNPTTTVVLRGLASDLHSLSTTVWLRPKSELEGYLEAIAKVLVYLVAAISGNATQVGNIVLLVLVLVSAGLLALSNARQRGLRSCGRVVEPSPEEEREGNTGYGRSWPLPAAAVEHGAAGTEDRAGRERIRRKETTASWPETSDLSGVSGSSGTRVRSVARTPLAPEGPVECEVRLETRAGTVVEVATLRDR